jgi:hypothetical protein
MEFAKIVTKLEVTRSVHVHGSNMEQPIMQAKYVSILVIKSNI